MENGYNISFRSVLLMVILDYSQNKNKLIRLPNLVTYSGNITFLKYDNFGDITGNVIINSVRDIVEVFHNH